MWITITGPFSTFGKTEVSDIQGEQCMDSSNIVFHYLYRKNYLFIVCPTAPSCIGATSWESNTGGMGTSWGNRTK